MRHVLIESDTVRLRVLPGLGAGVQELSIRNPHGEWQPVLRPSPEHPDHFNALACYLLAPWSNRIRDAAFEFGDKRHTLRPDWPDGTAIHGLVKDKSWRVLDRSPVSVRLAFDSRDHDPSGYPAAFTCTARYEVDGPDLRCDLAVTLDPEAVTPAPVGLGFHPFFLRRLWDERDDAVLTCRAFGPDTPRGLRGRYPAERMIPTGPAAHDPIVARLASGCAVGAGSLDDVFLGSLDAAEVRWQASGVRAVFECSPGLDHAVIYAAGGAVEKHPWFCVEPVSMVNDGFNLHRQGWPDTGVRALAPGKTFAASWSVRLERA